VELTAARSLADLQRVIQISLGWSEEYQHRFCIRNHYLSASRAGDLLFCGDPEEMPLSRFAFRLYERFTYEYNFFDAWLLDIRFEGEHALDPKRRHPRWAGHGNIGRKFCASASRHDVRQRFAGHTSYCLEGAHPSQRVVATHEVMPQRQCGVKRCKLEDKIPTEGMQPSYWSGPTVDRSGYRRQSESNY
jgi:hypothetical protein